MRIFFEADSIANSRMSGIGHATLEMIMEFDRRASNGGIKVTAIVPFGRKKFVEKTYGWRNVSVKQLPPGFKYINYALTRTSLPIPVDFWYGKGLYIFPNYKNWYTLFSRSITFIDDVAFKLFPETIQPRNLAYLNANFKRWLRRADMVVSISRQSTKEVETAFPELKGKVKTVYLGVDQSIFAPQTKETIEKIRQKYAIDQDYFLVLGNIEPRKNIDRLLEAYKMYVDKVAERTQLVLVGGDGWNHGAALKTIKTMKNEGYNILRPEVYVEDEDLPMLYSGARVLVCVPIHEGFGLPPLQAQACGTPVIVSDIPVFHETIEPKTATFVDPYDVEAIASALIASKAYQERRQSNVRKDLTWKNTADALLAIAEEPKG